MELGAIFMSVPFFLLAYWGFNNLNYDIAGIPGSIIIALVGLVLLIYGIVSKKA